MAKALVVGSGGQDGTYLSTFLRDKGYQVQGWTRSGGDIRDGATVRRAIHENAPDELYYLAAFHHSSEKLVLTRQPLMAESFAINTLSFNNFLEAVSSEVPHCRVFYAASSKVFGIPASAVQNEETPFAPRCPYGISKTAGILLCRYYREQQNVFCSAGILYNHESPLRGAEFVTRKVVRGAVGAKQGSGGKLVLGNLEARVDWGYAPDYVAAMWSILQLDQAGDFIVSSGELHSVRELVEIAFDAVGLPWRDYVEEDPHFVKRGDAQPLRGDSSKLRRLTGWSPKISFPDMIREMVREELEAAK